MTIAQQDNIKPEPYITIPRYILSNLRNGVITYREYELYVWIRLQANRYGISDVSVKAILENLPHFKSTDYTTKVLRSLRRKEYVYYQRRQGRRGSFEVHFGDWLLPGKRIKQINRHFDIKELRSEKKGALDNESEVNRHQEDRTPKLDDSKTQIAQAKSVIEGTVKVGSSYNEYDTDKVNHTNESLGKKTFKGTRVEDFQPNDNEESRVKDIALDVGAEYIDSLRAVLRLPNGFVILEEAWGLFREDRQRGKPIKDPPGYFYGIVKKRMNEK